MSSVVDVDAFGNVLDVQVSTVGVDATMHITRTVKNDVDHWMLGLPDTQTECSTATGLTLCRTIARTTNTFGEVESEATSSSDGLKDTQLSVRYERDKYGNVTRIMYRGRKVDRDRCYSKKWQNGDCITKLASAAA